MSIRIQEAEAIRFADGLMDTTAEKPVTRRDVRALFDALLSSRKLVADKKINPSQADQWVRDQRKHLFPNVSDAVIDRAKKILDQFSLERNPYARVREVSKTQQQIPAAAPEQTEL